MMEIMRLLFMQVDNLVTLTQEQLDPDVFVPQREILLPVRRFFSIMEMITSKNTMHRRLQSKRPHILLKRL